MAVNQLEGLLKKDRYLEIINRFATHLISCQTVDDIVWAVAKNAVGEMGFEDCVVYLLDEKENILIQRAAHGPKNPIDLDILNPITLNIGEGIVGNVAKTGKGEIINDTRLDSRYVMDDDMRLSEIAVPIIHENKVIGIIDSEHTDAEFYREEDLEILLTIASMSASRIMQTRYFEELKRHQEELEILVEERTEELGKSLAEVEQQKILLADRNRELMDSMNYAQRIQSSILPSKELLNRIFSSHFVYYRPKDIVSGDFYWAMEFNGYRFIAVADCTGHGVPGALLSLMGSNALHDAVHSGLTNPGEILTNIRSQIVKALNTSQNSKLYDGMDIGLCVFDEKNNQLLFAGANHNLFIFKNDNFEIIKGDRQAVGYYDAYLDFNTAIIHVESDSSFYLFSDGYKDQFGGELGKKFKQIPFLDMLKKIANLPMNEQSSILHREFENWKQNFEQIDDVCILGFKL